MSKFISQQIIYRQTYKTASRPPGLNGIVSLLDGYDASKLLRLCNTVKFISNVKVKQTNAKLNWKYGGIYMSTKHTQTDL